MLYLFSFKYDFEVATSLLRSVSFVKPVEEQIPQDIYMLAATRHLVSLPFDLAGKSA